MKIIKMPFIHATTTLIVFEYFLIKQNEINQNFINKNNAKNDTEIYFKKLNTQWN